MSTAVIIALLRYTRRTSRLRKTSGTAARYLLEAMDNARSSKKWNSRN